MRSQAKRDGRSPRGLRPRRRRSYKLVYKKKLRVFIKKYYDRIYIIDNRFLYLETASDNY